MPQNKTSRATRNSAQVTAEVIRFAAPTSMREISLNVINFDVPCEQAYAIHFGGQPYAVMMLSPSDLTDFAIGFALTEGVIETAADIVSITISKQQQDVIDIQLHPERFKKHLARQRSLIGRSSCGICGIVNPADLLRANTDHAATHEKPDHAMPAPSAVHDALMALEQHQPLHQRTHAVHAAAWCAMDGHIMHLREDVGRHNALDKLIGALAYHHMRPQQGFLLITSRCSFEMVEKAASFGIRTLVAISAPTSLALTRAKDLGITLIALARPDRALLFHAPERAEGVLCP
jgi:FdhD protein